MTDNAFRSRQSRISWPDLPIFAGSVPIASLILAIVLRQIGLTVLGDGEHPLMLLPKQ